MHLFLQRNAGVVLNGKTAALLYTLYRGAPSIGYTQLQAVGARVIVRAVVTVHSWKPHNQVRVCDCMIVSPITES